MGFDFGNLLGKAGDALGSIGSITGSIDRTLNTLRYGKNILQGITLKNLLNGSAFPHTYKSGAKTKGYLIDAETNEMKKFQFNPQSMEYSRGANYAEIAAPGMQYPLIYFVNGETKEFELELFLYDRPSSGKILKDIAWLEGFLPEYRNDNLFKRPHPVIFAYGGVVCKCVVTRVVQKHDEYDEKGLYMAHVVLSLKVVDIPKEENKAEDSADKK